MLDRLTELNLKYQANAGQGKLEGKRVFEFVDRKSEIVLSAPHATQTWVRQAVKKSDLYTGAITEYLGERLGFSTIVRQKFVAGRVMIEDFITAQKLENKFFLDIHGIACDKPFELGVGTGQLSALDYAKEIRLIQNLAHKYKIKTIINHPDYRGAAGLTRKLQEIHHQPRILQLEWRLDMRDFLTYPHNAGQRLIPFMLELAMKLEECHSAR